MILYVTLDEANHMEELSKQYPKNPEELQNKIKAIIGDKAFDQISSVKAVKVTIVKERKIFNFTRIQEEKGDVIYPVNSLTF